MEQKCPLCQRLLELRKSENPVVIERFKHSTLIVGDHQTYPGYCVLVLNHHVREPHELPAGVQGEVFAELTRAGKAIEKAFNPDKINYACYGNMVPHIHWHVFPRRKSDKKLARTAVDAHVGVSGASDFTRPGRRGESEDFEGAFGNRWD